MGSITSRCSGKEPALLRQHTGESGGNLAYRLDHLLRRRMNLFIILHRKVIRLIRKFLRIDKAIIRNESSQKFIIVTVTKLNIAGYLK